MLAKLREATTGQLMHIELAPAEEQLLQQSELPPMQAHHIDATTGLDELALADAAIAAGSAYDRGVGPPPDKRAPLQHRKVNGEIDPKAPATWGKVSRNNACPCGSRHAPPGSPQ